MNALLAMLRDDEAATLIEYALVLSLIAVVAIAGLQLVYQSVSATLNNVTGKLSASQSGS
jgi:Flp pilus assembly pilin Flp